MGMFLLEGGHMGILLTRRGTSVGEGISAFLNCNP